uniref:Uncharacterized protein n=1 Tax=Ditylenchus dipsaci TaxID=166011 RepID=A0A915E934_9BILA
MSFRGPSTNLVKRVGTVTIYRGGSVFQRLPYLDRSIFLTLSLSTRARISVITVRPSYSVIMSNLPSTTETSQTYVHLFIKVEAAGPSGQDLSVKNIMQKSVSINELISSASSIKKSKLLDPVVKFVC